MIGANFPFFRNILLKKLLYSIEIATLKEETFTVRNFREFCEFGCNSRKIIPV